MVQPFLPNEADAFHDNQAEPDSVDIEILLLGYERTGVVSGCAVTESSPAAQTVDVAAGVAILAGSQITVALQEDEAVTAADGTNPRFDLITVNSSGSVVVTPGTPAAQPVLPAIPASSVPLAALYIPTSDNSHADNQIVDKRVFIGPPRTDLKTRYVTTDGNNSDDGLTWETAFLTIEAAIADLPTVGSGGTLRHTGIIRIGPGLFTENNPLEVNEDIWFIGNGSGNFADQGTEIRGSNNAHLFAPTGAFTDFAHNVLIKNLRLSGDGITGNFDLLRIRKGGFECIVASVFFRQAPRHGLYILANAVTMAVRDCVWATITGDAIYFELFGAIPNLEILRSQADGVGGFFLNIEHNTLAGGAIIQVNGLKIESTTDGHIQRIVNFKPKTAAGGNPPHIEVANITAAQNGDGGIAVCYEENEAGVPANWTLRHLYGQSYQYAFFSAKTGQTSQSNDLREGNFGDPASFNTDEPAFEVEGISFDVDDGTPEAAIGRPIGSLYSRRDGSLGTSLYTKAADPLVAAQGTLTMDTIPADGNTMTVDTKVYTFQTTLTDVNGNVNIGGTLAQAKLNIVAAMDLSGTPGTDYATSMTAHTSVDMATFVSDDSVLTAKRAGTAGDSIATTETFTPVTNIFDAATLGTTTAGDDGDTGWRPVGTGATEEAGAVTLDWEDAVVNMESTAATRVVTLPDNAAFNGKSYLIRRDGANTVTVDRAGSDTFDDADIQKTLDSDSAAIGIFSIGDGEWKIIGTEGTVGGS